MTLAMDLNNAVYFRILEKLDASGNSRFPTQKVKQEFGRDVYEMTKRYKEHFKYKGKYLHIDPIRQNSLVFRLCIHMSQFETYSEIRRWLGELTGGLEFLSAPIKRLDLCVDVTIPFLEVFKTVNKSRVKTIRHYQSKSESLYLGFGKRFIRIYEKSPRYFDDVERSKSLVMGTRIEIEYRGRTLPIKVFTDLEKIQKLEPFKDLKFSSISSFIGTSDKINDHLKLRGFEMLVNECGFAAARKIVNSRGGNFSRLRKKVVELDTIDCQKYWNNRCKRFFKDESN